MKAMNKNRSTRHFLHIVLAGVVVVGLSGCTDRGDEELAPDDTLAVAGDTTGMMMNDPGGMQADPGAMQGHMAMEGDTVEVSLVDHDINMPSTLPPGFTVFRVTNQGDEEHNFEVEGQGDEHVFPQDLQPGETQTMEVDLQEGSYVVYCPVSNHRSLGMELNLTVTS